MKHVAFICLQDLLKSVFKELQSASLGEHNSHTVEDTCRDPLGLSQLVYPFFHFSSSSQVVHKNYHFLSFLKDSV